MKMQLKVVINSATSKFFLSSLFVKSSHWKPRIDNDINLIEKDCFAKRIFSLLGRQIDRYIDTTIDSYIRR